MAVTTEQVIGYIVVDPIKHNGIRYEADATIPEADIDQRDADNLLAIGSIEPHEWVIEIESDEQLPATEGEIIGEGGEQSPLDPPGSESGQDQANQQLETVDQQSQEAGPGSVSEQKPEAAASTPKPATKKSGTKSAQE